MLPILQTSSYCLAQCLRLYICKCHRPSFHMLQILNPCSLAQAQDFRKCSPQTSEPRPFASPIAQICQPPYTAKMSKTKTKRARRELKREGDRKIAAHHKKLAKAAIETNKSAATKQPAKKKQQQQKPSTTTPATPTTTVTTTSASTPAAPVQASQNHAIPFGAYSHILLVGEGDFSFARSLAIDHGCANVVGTSYDTEAEVREKYPTFADVEAELEGLAPPVPLYHGIDATRLSSYKQLRCRREDGDDDELDEDREGEEEGPSGEGWDTIAFMFPHTGGLSTDVNRQVRVNQALLVGFFKACLDTSTAKRRLAILEAQKNKVCLKAFRMAYWILTTYRLLRRRSPSCAWAVVSSSRSSKANRIHSGMSAI
jgi:hypothetical protein